MVSLHVSDALYFQGTVSHKTLQAQTPRQRQANARFAKEQESRMGKSEDQLKKRAKDQPKSPISPMWLGELPSSAFC